MQKENKKEQIIQAAIKLFAKNGFEATSTRDICKLANANISLIAYYFGGKQELYDEIISSFIEKVANQVSEFAKIENNLNNMTLKEKVELMKLTIDKLMNYFYNSVSTDMIELLLKEQQNPDTKVTSPPYNFMRKIMGSILNKDPDSKEVVYKCMFIFSQISFVRIARLFTLRIFKQNEFEQDDINFIKNNINLAINTVLKEAGVSYE